jgi:hypothetical protein
LPFGFSRRAQAASQSINQRPVSLIFVLYSLHCFLSYFHFIFFSISPLAEANGNDYAPIVLDEPMALFNLLKADL